MAKFHKGDRFELRIIEALESKDLGTFYVTDNYLIFHESTLEEIGITAADDWPTYGDEFYSIEADMDYGTFQINKEDYMNAQSDRARKETGNCYRTEEEAMAAIERIKKAMKGDRNERG